MKAASQHVKVVQMNVLPVQTIVRGIRAWSSVNAFVENVLTSVADVQMPAEATVVMLPNYCSNVPMPVAGALKNVKSMIQTIASVVQKNAESVKLNAVRLLPKYLLRAFYGKPSISIF